MDEAQQARLRSETERLRNSLLSAVSHDLRTPLATITGSASALVEQEASSIAAARRELAQAIQEEADRLNRLVQNLLEMTRLESGGIRVRKDWEPLEEVVGSALARVEKRLGERRVDIQLAPDLPLVPLDPLLIEQVLINLLDNAIKYTSGRHARSRSRPPPTDRAVRVIVADRGPGFAPGEETRVFEKFYRGQEAGTRSGAGLGLAIARGIVEVHGGRSRRNPARAAGPCSGSPCHWPRIPRRSGRTMAETESGREPSRSPTAGPVVLVIEDEPPIRRFLRPTLTSQGYRLVEAETGEDGLVQAATRQPDLVILDLGLPDLDGLQVIRRLREWTRGPNHRPLRPRRGGGQGCRP